MFENKKNVILFQVCFLSLLAVGAKLFVAKLGLEIEFSSILPALISSTIFFLGFILNGVLIDYKEAEKIPDEIVVSIEAIFEQCVTTYSRTHDKDCLKFIKALEEFMVLLDSWFLRKIHTRDLMLKLHSFNDHIIKMEALTQPVFINRIKTECSNLRRYLLRTYSIRETEFLGSSHVITLMSLIFVFVNLIITKYDTVFQSFLYVFGFSAIFIFIFKLVYDLDNPFDYYSANNKYKDSVSLQSLYDLNRRISGEIKLLEKVKRKKS